MACAFSAVVLAAGHSARMGRDKARLEVDGTPMWRRQRDILAHAGAAEIFLNARPEQDWVRGANGFAGVLCDAFPGCGPIVGISAAIERASQPHVAVLAIDLPRMSATWFESLLSQCAPGIGIVGQRGECFEPLAAIYPREMKWLVWETIARGDYALQKLIATAVAQGFLRERMIADEEAALFENWNEPVSAPQKSN